MEFFAGDRQIPNPDRFPQQISPFPEPTDLIYDHPTAVIYSPDIINHRPISPPRKLRPIRCTARSPAREFPDHEGLVGTLGSGFLSGQSGCFDGEFEWAVKVEGGEAPPMSAVCRDVSVMTSDPIIVGSGTAVEGWETNGVKRGLENESEVFSVLSSSSDDDVNYMAANIKSAANKKRRRKSRRNDLEHFLESLVMKAMEKQEEMYKQLIEMVEKMEKERATREEAWKQLEIERRKRDKMLRAEETSRSLAFISFIQNLLGEEVQIPELGPQQSMEENEVKTDSQPDNKCDPNNKIRWPKAEVQPLIALRTALEHKFRVSGLKGSIWEEISVGMHGMGYNRTAKKCKEKWESINKYFKRWAESGKKLSLNGHKTRQYFHNLDLMYRSGLVNPGVDHVSEITNNGDDAKSERDSESL